MLQQHPDALAQALREVPRSRPFESLEELGALEVPALVVASNDDADPGHPYESAAAYAEALPAAQLRQRGRGGVAARLAGRQALADPGGVLRKSFIFKR